LRYTPFFLSLIDCGLRLKLPWMVPHCARHGTHVACNSRHTRKLVFLPSIDYKLGRSTSVLFALLFVGPSQITLFLDAFAKSERWVASGLRPGCFFGREIALSTRSIGTCVPKIRRPNVRYHAVRRHEALIFPRYTCLCNHPREYRSLRNRAPALLTPSLTR